MRQDIGTTRSVEIPFIPRKRDSDETRLIRIHGENKHCLEAQTLRFLFWYKEELIAMQFFQLHGDEEP